MNFGSLALSMCPAHSMQRLSAICFERECTDKGAICRKCKEGHHQGHRCVTFGVFQRIVQLKANIQRSETNHSLRLRQQTEDMAQQLQQLREAVELITSNLQQIATNQGIYEEEVTMDSRQDALGQQTTTDLELQ